MICTPIAREAAAEVRRAPRRWRRQTPPLLGWLVLLVMPVAAQDPVQMVLAPSVLVVAPGATATVRLSLKIAASYHVFSTVAQLSPRGGGPNPTTLALRPGAPCALAGPPRTSPPRKTYDPNFESDVLTLEGDAWIDVSVRADVAAAPGEHVTALVVGYQACTEESCLPPVEAAVPLRLRITRPDEAGAAAPRWRELADGLAAVPRAAEREEHLQRMAALAWSLFEEHPGDPRGWSAWESLWRNSPRFPGDESGRAEWERRTAIVENAVAAAADAPESLRELLASRKVSALVLPFTNGTLPSDWAARLVPAIESLAAQYPAGTGAFVYFSRLVSAVEAQVPAEMPALVARLEASPNARVRELGAKRRAVLAALSQPLDLVFTALDGRRVDTKEWRGRVVIVDFWATWCVPCIEAMPHLRELYAAYHERGLEIVNISLDQAAARPALEKLVEKLALPWPQAFDGRAHQGEFAGRYGVQPIPHLLLAGPDGRIAAVNPRGPRLAAEVRRLLGLDPEPAPVSSPR